MSASMKRRVEKIERQVKADIPPAVPIHTMPLPETIVLKESQRLALNALNNDEQRLGAEIRQLEQQIGQRKELIAQTQAARLSVLTEIEQDHKLASGVIASDYQYNGESLLRAGK